MRTTVSFFTNPTLRRICILVFVVLSTWSARTPDARAQGSPSPGLQARADATDGVMTTQFGEGWFAEETLSTGPFRWMSVVGHIDVTAKRAGTLVTRGRIRSYVLDNSAELLVDDKVVQSIKLSGTDWQECVLRIPLSAGTHHLLLRSHQPGKQPAGDSRVLTICLENFQARLEP